MHIMRVQSDHLALLNLHSGVSAESPVTWLFLRQASGFLRGIGASRKQVDCQKISSTRTYWELLPTFNILPSNFYLLLLVRVAGIFLNVSQKCSLRYIKEMQD